MISAPLPNLDALDIEALKALVIAQHESSHQQIEHLKLVIEKYRRMLFGSKSEKLTGQLEQLEFQLEELETEQAASEAAQPSSSSATTKSRRRAGRKPLPEDLPREVITHLPPHTCCPDCGGALRQFGEDVSEQLERLPATYKVIQHVRPKFSCAACEQVVEAPAPARPIDHGLPGPGLLAHVLVSKFGDHRVSRRRWLVWQRRTIQKMGVGPSMAAIRSRYQTPVCCCR